MVHKDIWGTSKLNPRNKYCECGSWKLEGKIFLLQNNYIEARKFCAVSHYNPAIWVG